MKPERDRHDDEVLEARRLERLRRESETRAARYLDHGETTLETLELERGRPTLWEAVMAWIIVVLMAALAVGVALLVMKATRWLFEGVFSVTNP